MLESLLVHHDYSRYCNNGVHNGQREQQELIRSNFFKSFVRVLETDLLQLVIIDLLVAFEILNYL